MVISAKSHVSLCVHWEQRTLEEYVELDWECESVLESGGAY